MYHVVHPTSQYEYTLAERFIIPHEKICCALMQRVLLYDESIFIIVEDSPSNQIIIHGVISYNNGKTVFHCLPQLTGDVLDALTLFFSTRHVFCITGKRDGTEFIQHAIKDRCSEVREYRFLEFNNHPETPINDAPEQIVLCTMQDIDSLMPLQIDYVRIEVLPASRTVNPAAERLTLEHTLKEQYVFAAKIDGKIVAKVQTNAIASQHAQIGGVYTKEEFRKRGIASRLVLHAAQFVLQNGKKPVLFVKEINQTAFHSYQKAGFIETDKFRIAYYDE